MHKNITMLSLDYSVVRFKATEIIYRDNDNDLHTVIVPVQFGINLDTARYFIPVDCEVLSYRKTDIEVPYNELLNI